MQTRFEHHYPSLDMEIIGVNEFGFGSQNSSFVAGRDLPWLQDTDSNNNGVSDVWYDTWNITYRDVVIVDQDNQEIARYNVTDHNLADESNFEALKNLFVEEAAVEPATEWQSPIEKLDVDGSGFIAARDALLIINKLADRTFGAAGDLPPLNGSAPSAHYDTTGDMKIAGQDAILVINHLIEVDRDLDASVRAPLSAAIFVATNDSTEDSTGGERQPSSEPFSTNDGEGHLVNAEVLARDRWDSQEFDVARTSQRAQALAAAAEIDLAFAEFIGRSR